MGNSFVWVKFSLVNLVAVVDQKFLSVSFLKLYDDCVMHCSCTFPGKGAWHQRGWTATGGRLGALLTSLRRLFRLKRSGDGRERWGWKSVGFDAVGSFPVISANAAASPASGSCPALRPSLSARSAFLFVLHRPMFYTKHQSIELKHLRNPQIKRTVKRQKLQNLRSKSRLHEIMSF